MKLLDRVAEVARVRRLSANTRDAYSGWVRNFLAFCRDHHGAWRHPAELGTADVERFLNDLVTRRRLSASSQNQALCVGNEVAAGCAGGPGGRRRRGARPRFLWTMVDDDI